MTAEGENEPSLCMIHAGKVQANWWSDFRDFVLKKTCQISSGQIWSDLPQRHGGSGEESLSRPRPGLLVRSYIPETVAAVIYTEPKPNACLSQPFQKNW